VAAKRKVNAKGRNEGGAERVVIIRRALLHAPQYSALSGTARSLLVELQAMFNGTNNGRIFLSCQDSADRLGLSDLKAARSAFEELRDLGFITETIGSSFTMKAGCQSKARAWNLNWINERGHCTGPDVLPPLDFQQLSETQKRRVARRSITLSKYLGDYQKGKFAVEDCSTLDVRKDYAGKALVEDSTTTKDGNGEKPPKSGVEESSHYIEYHRGTGAAWTPYNPYLSCSQMDWSQFATSQLSMAA
jgi:hypothetical protein